ncbi:torsin family 1 isoform X1 [Micropterus salmoides]|uniref:torsin family 1 isoform X1 n=1 Tax=Micropterus salmoides TaxID=27706 RepID=UPI0018ECF8F5|nr:torsin family 1 isoform X1 [Micropterus salmoides]
MKCEMKPKKRHVLLLWMLVCSGMTEAIEPISTSIAVGMAAALTGFLASYQNILYYFHECCRPEWISFNRTGLQADLERKLFGQHIASRIILKAVSGFMSNDNPKKPLVLSLHGWTGTGKNFVSNLIAENIYKEGMDSSFVHVFTAELHFPHVGQLDTYKSQLQQWIKGNVTNCERSMFIFDEMDKMHPGLIDSIKPYLDYYEKLDGVSYRKSIFIFLSNAGGENIVQTALDFWKAGQIREEIELKDLETVLSVSVFNSKNSGLRHASLIDKNLVDFFVPFLPLEYRHVVQCALAEMKARGLRPNQEVADLVARDLVYFPKSERVFSVKGCKTIQSKLDYYT